MSERLIPETHETKEAPAKGSIRIFNFRHSAAAYQAYETKLSSDSPQGPIEVDSQPENDLTEKGIALAHESAEKFFDQMNPEHDVFYVVSSTQTRTLETAKIYAEVALARGFTVVNHGKKTGSEFAKKLGGGYVRSLESLSLKDDTLLAAAFYPPSKMPAINWDSIDPEIKRKFEEVRARTVEEHDYGSWGANMFHYAPEVKKVFPDTETAAELYEGQFGKLRRLSEFANRKGSDQHINVLSFGHENYMGTALEQDTGNHALANCEALELVDGKLTRLAL